jgi:ABC-2 type transport system permease protein
VLASILSLYAIVQGLIGVEIVGSVGLFAFAATVYLFAVTALGITLSTVARSMQQFGLLCIPVFVVMNMLSGTITPLESMPGAFQAVMQGSPSTHFVKAAQAILYRGAGLDVVWRDLLVTGFLGIVFLMIALLRFRASMAAER